MSGLYGYRWQQRSKRFLAAHPLCIMCQRQGKTTAATIVDHVIRHNGNLSFLGSDQLATAMQASS
jgi:5-methylcytosine-specific restriction protein A